MHENARASRCADCGGRSLYLRRASGRCPRCDLKRQGGLRTSEEHKAKTGTPSPSEDVTPGPVQEAGRSFDPYLSLERLSEYSSLSVRTLQRHLRNPFNSIPYFRIGRKTLVRQSDFDAWMRRHLQPQASEAFEAKLQEMKRRFGLSDATYGTGRVKHVR